MRKSLLLMPLFIAASLEALVEKRIDERNPIETVFSRSSHNRICVEGGAVEKIVGDGAVFSVAMDASTGHAFINVLKEIPKPITLTVITSSGFVQDLLVSSQDCPSEQVVLREGDDWGEVNIDNFQGVSVVEMLNKILEGKTPFGYGQRAFTPNEEILGLPNLLKAEPLKAFEGALDTLCVYKIRNDGKQAIVVTADALKKENHSWVFLNVQELGYRQEALCVIAYPKDRN